MLILPGCGLRESSFDALQPWRRQIGRALPSHPWTLVARRPRDGAVLWRGRFRDRDELDVFLWSLSRGELERDEFARSLSLPAWNPELAEWPVVYELAISVSDGTSATTTSAANSASFSNTTSIPNGAAIFAACSSVNNSGTVTGAGTFSDGVNTYATAASVLFDNSSSDGILVLFAALASAGLASSGKTFQWTPAGSYTGYYAISTFYATGVSSQDSAVTNTAYGSANPVSWSFSGSATPSVSGELVICATGAQNYAAGSGMGGSITSPSGGTTPPDFLNTATTASNLYAVLIGTNVVQSAAAAITYTGSFNNGAARVWAALIAAFKPAATTVALLALPRRIFLKR